MLKRVLRNWLIGVIAVALTVWLMSYLPARLQLKWDPAWRIAVFVPVLAVVNTFIGSVVRLCTFPINCLTLGLFGFVINAAMFEIAGRLTQAQNGEGDPIGFFASLIGSVVYTVISAPLSAFAKERK